MASSLGIFIEKDIIKYAKLHKEKDSIRVESFSVEFYEKGNVGAVVKKIINETNSQKIPVNINISNELYNYFETFSMLSKKDTRESIDIEFDLLCGEKGYNRKSLEARYILTGSRENTDKFKVLHISADKNLLNKRANEFAPYKINSSTPISTSITNLLAPNDNEDVIIVNIENETKITTVIDGQIYRTDVISDGMGKILDRINQTESDVKKSYEVCKNITVYSQGQGSSMDGNDYVEEITPILDNIINETKEILESTFANIKKVYITGAGTIINNVDLYFQEYLSNCTCEVLRPYFLESSSLKIPVKEYIEVNSAMALALNGLGYLNKELNFSVKPVLAVNLKDVFNFIERKTGGKDNVPQERTVTTSEKLLLRICLLAGVIWIGYSVLSNYTMKQIEAKSEEIQTAIGTAEMQLKIMEGDKNRIVDATSTYTMLLDNLQKLTADVNSQETNRIIDKDAIPNLLNRLMYIIPKDVQINSIENTNGKHIVIEAVSEEYEQLGYFMAAIKTGNVLLDVKSSSGAKEASEVKIVIEGVLP